MNVCTHCHTPIPDQTQPCPRCAQKPSRPPTQPLFSVTVKGVLITLAVVVLGAIATVAWILHSLGPMPSFG